MTELTGTEKQIKFANALKSDMTTKIESAIKKAESILDSTKDLEAGDLQILIELQVGSMSSALILGGIEKDLESEKVLGILKTCLKWMNSQKTAKWWIENGNFTSNYIVARFCKKYVTVS